MTPHVVTATDEMGVEAATALMLKEGIVRPPVLRGKTLVGFLAHVDIINAFGSSYTDEGRMKAGNRHELPEHLRVGGVTATWVKEGKFGLTLIRAEGPAAWFFTRNLVKAAPIVLMEKNIRRGLLGAVIVNRGCANAYTGKRGYDDAVMMAEYAGSALGIAPDLVGVASTGVIGRYLDLPLIRPQCTARAPKLASTPETEELAAPGIMTTDTFPKHALVQKETFCVGGIAKGSGMIALNMGTMLAFLYTDAEIGAARLQPPSGS